ncbi:MAG: Hsp70 family protein [Myxococcota bacterium]
MKIGIDFGTTNSAVAVVAADGRPAILELVPGERFQRTVIHGGDDGRLTFGNAAFTRYLESDLTGRFIRSIKAFLPHDVPKTTLAGRRYAFTDLVTAYLRYLVQSAEQVTGETVTDVVVGRPVRFHADPDKDRAALARLQASIADAGLARCTLQLEPVAAAHRYEFGLTTDRTVLVGDFGGGTSDFAILRVGPSRVAGDRLRDVLGTSGVARAGDALDARFMDTFLMEYFGRGATWRNRHGEMAPWWHPVQNQIRRLYYLHLLRDRSLDEGLQRIEPRMSDPTVIRRIRRLVFDDLGYPMAYAIEACKRELSDTDATTFRFGEFHSPTLDIEHPVDLRGFADGCAELLDAYRRAIHEVVEVAGLGIDRIDDVFLTGGTSQLPFIRGLFADLFGADKLRTADSFTSVCEGLALSA